MAETIIETKPSIKEEKTTVSTNSIPDKKPDYVIFRLIHENPEIKGRPDIPKYPPYISFKNTDVIAWKDEKSGEVYERSIRYLSGYESIFVDEQEKNGRIIPERILNDPKNKFVIQEGYLRLRPSEKTKIQFAEWCNRNEDSLYRTGKVQAIFKKYSEESRTKELATKQKLQKRATDMSFSLSDEVLVSKASLLGIQLIDMAGASRKQEAIVADCRDIAFNKPDEFLKVFE